MPTLGEWIDSHPKVAAIVYHPAISPVNHGLVVSASIVAFWWVTPWLLPSIPHPETFGAGVGFGGGMFFYSQREVGDLQKYVFGRPWADRTTQVKLADSWLDWTVAFIFGLATVHLLLV